MDNENYELNYNLKIIGNNYELSTTGSLEALQQELDAIFSFVEKIKKKFEKEFAEPVPTEEELSSIASEDIPSIKPTKSTTENVRLLFDTEWGRKSRSLAEVMKALEVNSVPDKAPNVSMALTRGVKSGLLRRIEKEGIYQYFRLPKTE